MILITDGIETCEADPCALATELENAGIDFTAHVVGFGLSNEEGRQIACLAENTGGKYIAAGNAEALGAALTETVVAEPAPPAPPPQEEKPEYNLVVTSRPAPDAAPFTERDSIRYDIHRATGDEFEETALTIDYGGDKSMKRFALPAGDYVIVASKDIARALARVTVTEDSQTAVDVVFDAGFIEARAMASENEPLTRGDVRWDITNAGGDTEINYGLTRRALVDAGEATVQASVGNAVVAVPVVVTAGTTQNVDVVVGAGQLSLKGKRSEEATDFDNGIRWDITGASGNTVTNYGGEITFDLAAGDYTIKATLGEAVVEVPVSVIAGNTIEKVVVVATGRAIAHAYFAEGGPAVTSDPRFDVMDPTPGTDGNMRTITTNYGDGVTFDLPPGSYIMRATSDAASAEAGFEIKAGPPTEVIVVLNAGIVAITAPRGDFLELLSSEKDIYGKQKAVAYTYGESWQLAAPAGEYVLKVRKTDGSEATAPVSVKAGQRTEVTVN